MFRPINSDDHTRFIPPSEHVKKAEASYRGQKRDFSYEIEQIQDETGERREKQGEPFGEDKFESSAEQEQTPDDLAGEQAPKDRIPPASGHVDVQI